MVQQPACLPAPFACHDPWRWWRGTPRVIGGAYQLGRAPLDGGGQLLGGRRPPAGDLGWIGLPTDQRSLPSQAQHITTDTHTRPAFGIVVGTTAWGRWWMAHEGRRRTLVLSCFFACQPHAHQDFGRQRVDEAPPPTYSHPPTPTQTPRHQAPRSAHLV
jgi:hypothetical protein